MGVAHTRKPRAARCTGEPLFAGHAHAQVRQVSFFGGTRTDGIRAYKKVVAYASAKTGLGILAKSIAAQGAPHNVAAVVVCPGPTETEYLDEETKIRHASLTATRSLARADHIAHIGLDLIDADSCIASGAIVTLDGGFSP